MYKVIKYFTDLQDNNHAYNVGDTFPHSGMEVSKERLEELSGTQNKRGIPLIEEIKEEKKTSKKAEKEPEKVEEAVTPEEPETKAEKEPKTAPKKASSTKGKKKNA